MIQILGLLGMYFDAVVVEVKTFSLLFRLALAMLWLAVKNIKSVPCHNGHKSDRGHQNGRI